MAGITFKQAQRSTARARIFLFGPSGFGKSISSLLIARGLTTGWEKILLVDTESGRGEACVHKKIGNEVIGDFFCYRLAPPFTVQKYLEVLVEAEKSKQFDVIIFDSISHAWAGKGGLLEKKEDVAKASKNPDQRAAWAPITAEYQELVEAILQTNLHAIMTARSKTAWDYEADDKGKLKPKIVGLAPVMRDGFQYEAGIILFMGGKGVSLALKDDTQLLPADEPFTPTIDTGKLIAGWYAENQDAAKASSMYGLKAEGYHKCPQCDGLMEMVDTEDVARLKVNIYRCKTNPSHVHREKGAA
jgi:hypothetical protein